MGKRHARFCSDTYCAQNVPTAALQIAPYKDCLAAVSKMDKGRENVDNDVDTFSCREHYLVGAKATSGVPAEQQKACKRTTLLGGDMCGSSLKRRKSAFCVKFNKHCWPAHSPFPDAPFEGEAGVWTACEEAVLAMKPGTAGDSTGDTFACREYHVDTALRDKAFTTHCPHAGTLGGGVCADDVGKSKWAFMQSFNKACKGISDAYTALDAKALAVVGSKQTTGNSLECRQYHLAAALAGGGDAKNTHCPHAGKAGGGVCVSKAQRVKDFCTAYGGTCKDTGPAPLPPDISSFLTTFPFI